MAILRSCCLCFSTRTGSFVLGTVRIILIVLIILVLIQVGIIIGATLLAPMAVFLDYHSYYITQFVASERVGGNYIDDDQVREENKSLPRTSISGSENGVLQQDALHRPACSRRHLRPLLRPAPGRDRRHKVSGIRSVL